MGEPEPKESTLQNVETTPISGANNKAKLLLEDSPQPIKPEHDPYTVKLPSDPRPSTPGHRS